MLRLQSLPRVVVPLGIKNDNFIQQQKQCGEKIHQLIKSLLFDF